MRQRRSRSDLSNRIRSETQESATVCPTFSEYEQAVRQSGGAVYYYGLRDENEFVPQRDLLRMLDSTQPDIVFLCNPNNPTGKTVAKELMTETAVWCQSNNAVLVIDECFLDFVRNGKALSMIGETEKNPNIIILKAFTKFFAMPGLRFGYLVCGSEELRKKIWKAGQPWSVSGVAQLCGAAALSDKTYIEQTKKLIPRFRENLQTELEKLPLRVYSGAANYILFSDNGAETGSKNGGAGYFDTQLCELSRAM